MAKSMGELYRGYAAQQQACADDAQLSNVRVIHERAAKKWLDMAERADRPGAPRRE